MGSLVTEYGLYREMKGEQEGFANGEKQGFANGLADCIRRLSRTFSPERIAELIQLPLEEVQAYLLL